MTPRARLDAMRDRLASVLGPSANRAARRLGLHPNAVRAYLRGAYMPQATTLMRIADVHEVSLDWLILGRGEREAPADRVGVDACAGTAPAEARE